MITFSDDFPGYCHAKKKQIQRLIMIKKKTILGLGKNSSGLQIPLEVVVVMCHLTIITKAICQATKD